MSADPIPVLQVRGTHREVGQQIGERLRPQLERIVASMREDLPAGMTWNEMVAGARLFLAHSRSVYPDYVDEMEGISDAAGLDLDEMFVGMCEELWEAPSRPAASRLRRGCTDLVARGRATVDGSTLVAHTNDLDPQVEQDLVILRVQAGNEPEFLGVSVGGLGYSAAFNAAGISLTGNQVSSHDVRIGVPRLVIVRAILAARRLGEALDACLLPQRASNYNNVIADAHGEVYSVEGSATDCEPIYIEGDMLAHANHYVSSPMRRFEADRNSIGGSVIRHNRARRLLRENHGHLSPERFRVLLADHANYPASICKHGEESVTVFSMIVNLGELRAWIGRGRPCQTTYVEHRLDPWTPPDDWPRL
jgi:isopenicillin-N N-acyltransferase-like protein